METERPHSRTLPRPPHKPGTRQHIFTKCISICKSVKPSYYSMSPILAMKSALHNRSDAICRRGCKATVAKINDQDAEL
ncbi:hypothetical protein SKAU_G00404580 [Synaphobranchus kaupii]|uniref:Uncharacterized protein n=1 Tax=Synaphobranchus kaupii TaxID=118154 RepID=A0A9Q1E9Q7_SYNKA|nr:hypothetical protein SKAU_G00404580 [Synaphobranchus kaupii]